MPDFKCDGFLFTIVLMGCSRLIYILGSLECQSSVIDDFYNLSDRLT
jgi:hypothetical protein